MKGLRLALLCLFPLLLAGCGRHWLVGKWTIDRETTLAGLSEVGGEPATPGEGFLKDLASGLQKGVSRLILSQFEGVEIEFTPTEMRRIREGGGEFETYRIAERPTPGLVVIQFDDGETATWAKTEGGVQMRLPGEEERWIHFRPANPKD